MIGIQLHNLHSKIRKDDVLQTLVLNLAQSEEQYMMALRGHLQSLDSFVGRHL